MGYNPRDLKEGVERLGDVHWSTANIEHGHGSAALVHRAHRDYGANMIAQRAFLHMTRALITYDGGRATSLQKRALTAKLEKLRARQPQKITGRHMFLQHCQRAVLAVPLESRKGVGNISMQQHSGMYNLPAPDEIAKFNAAAETRVIDERNKIHDGILTVTRELLALDLPTEYTDNTSLTMARCPFGPSDFQSMAAMWNSDEFSRAEVDRMRDNVMGGIVAPEPELQKKDSRNAL